MIGEDQQCTRARAKPKISVIYPVEMLNTQVNTGCVPRSGIGIGTRSVQHTHCYVLKGVHANGSTKGASFDLRERKNPHLCPEAFDV